MQAQRLVTPSFLHVRNYTNLYNLQQGNFSVEKHTREFEKLLIKYDIQESEDQTIVRYLVILAQGIQMWCCLLYTSPSPRD